MHTIKCDNCGNSLEVEEPAKKYILPLFVITLGMAILAYENMTDSPSLFITIPGVLFASAGLVWLVLKRLASYRKR